MTASEELKTQSLELAREELAAVLDAHREDPGYLDTCVCETAIPAVWPDRHYAHHVADALLASPVLARVIREAEAEAWGEGQTGGYICAQGYHAHGDGHGPDSWDCDCPNPYRDQTGEPT